MSGVIVAPVADLVCFAELVAEFPHRGLQLDRARGDAEVLGPVDTREAIDQTAAELAKATK